MAIEHIRILEDENGNEYVDPQGRRKYTEKEPIRPTQQKKLPSGGAPWRMVVVKDTPPVFDGEIYQRYEAGYEIKRDRVIHKFELRIVPNAEEILEYRIDNIFEKKRNALLKQAGIPALQLQEYAYAVEEAKEALDIAVRESRQIERGEFLYLDAAVGVTINPISNKPVTNPLESAKLILEKDKEYKRHMSFIRRDRLKFKNEVRKMASLEEKIKAVNKKNEE